MELAASAVRWWRPGRLMVLRNPVVVWCATSAFGLPAYVNIDHGRRASLPSPDTSRCAGAHGHGRENCAEHLHCNQARCESVSRMGHSRS